MEKKIGPTFFPRCGKKIETHGSFCAMHLAAARPAKFHEQTQ